MVAEVVAVVSLVFSLAGIGIAWKSARSARDVLHDSRTPTIDGTVITGNGGIEFLRLTNVRPGP